MGLHLFIPFQCFELGVCHKPVTQWKTTLLVSEWSHS